MRRERVYTFICRESRLSKVHLITLNLNIPLGLLYIYGGPAEMTRLCMRINQSIFEIYLYLIP